MKPPLLISGAASADLARKPHHKYTGDMVLIFFDALRWLFARGIKEYFHAWGNLHWFLYHYFSVPVLARTFFAPFHRLRERRARGFDPEDWASVLAVNTLMRFVGMIVRSVFLVVALLSQFALLIVATGLFALFVSIFVSVPALAIIGIMLIF